jgi:CPA2 family monovalent cation:H+ antiporter-2
MEQFEYILILLGFSVTVVALFRRIHLPPILGYLFVGMIVGPGGMGFIPSIQDLTFLAEFGVVFLMFTIGLEFSLSRLLTMRRNLLGLGGVQVLLCTAVAAVVGWMLGLPPKTAFITAGALALSSTAVVMKQLAEQNELHSIHGQLAVSILLFQDLAAVLFLILIPALGTQEAGSFFIPSLMAIIKGIGVCIALALVGQWLLRPLFHEVAKSHSTELFMLAALLVALSASWVTQELQLSMALGAFLAGLMLGETEFRHQIEMDIRPFRDVLLGLFFVTIGALLQISYLPKHWHWVLAILISLITVKTLIIMGLTRIVAQKVSSENNLRKVEKISFPKAFRTGLILAQGGEFGFVVLTVAINHDLIDPIQSQVVVAAVVLSIVIAPLLIRYNKTISHWIFKQAPEQPIEEPKPYELAEHAAALNDHVIICGFGRVGQILARFLEQECIPSIALDLDPVRVSSSTLAGEHAFYGDARRPEVLAASGLARARMVVISFADEPAALETLEHIRAFRLDVPVFVRTRNDSNLHAFQEAGATEVVPESLEASLMLASHLLLTLGVPASRILFKIRAIHADRYRIMQGFFKGTDDATLLEEEESVRKSLHAITITENAYAVGKTIEAISGADARFAIKVLTRGLIRYPDPEPDMVIEAGDVLVMYATPEAIYTLGEKMLTGS